MKTNTLALLLSIATTGNAFASSEVGVDDTNANPTHTSSAQQTIENENPLMPPEAFLALGRDVLIGIRRQRHTDPITGESFVTETPLQGTISPAQVRALLSNPTVTEYKLPPKTRAP